MSEKFRRLQELFDRARKLSTEEREQYLTSEIGDDAELEEAIQRLLRYHDSGTQLFENRAIQLADSRDDDASSEEPEKDREVTDH